MTKYAVKILDNRIGEAYGINANGLVVGGIDKEQRGEELGVELAWWAQPNFAPSGPSQPLSILVDKPPRVNNAGLISLSRPLPASIVGCNSNTREPLTMAAPPVDRSPVDIDEGNYLILEDGSICPISLPSSNIVAPPWRSLPENWPDYSYRGKAHFGLLYAGSSAEGQGILCNRDIIELIDGCRLIDVNDYGLAVGVATGGRETQAAYVSLLGQSNTWVVTPIPFPGATALVCLDTSPMAVNDANTVVGTVRSAETRGSTYPFVYEHVVGATPAQDLNSLIDFQASPGVDGYKLVTANDIDGFGQIVGAIQDPAGNRHPYIATPTNLLSTSSVWLSLGLGTGDTGPRVVETFLFYGPNAHGPAQPYIFPGPGNKAGGR
jgi:hypothetical protein